MKSLRLAALAVLLTSGNAVPGLAAEPVTLTYYIDDNTTNVATTATRRYTMRFISNSLARSGKRTRKACFDGGLSNLRIPKDGCHEIRKLGEPTEKLGGGIAPPNQVHFSPADISVNIPGKIFRNF